MALGFCSPAQTPPTSPPRPILQLEIRDADTDQPVAARFSLKVNGIDWTPDSVDGQGLRFISHHDSKQQVFVATYTRGTGPVTLKLPRDARQVTVHAVRGLETFPVRETTEITSPTHSLVLRLRQWSNLRKQGWLSCDAHLHYDRYSPRGDADWFAMLKGDGLDLAHFMMLKGGKVPGLWALQYGYGTKGEAGSEGRFLTAGEEYRDSAMGHINLFGLDRVIEPIMSGNGRDPNWPPLFEVMLEARKLGGFAGVAHGSALGREPTAIVDAILGSVDFFEIANTHLYYPEIWYHLLNCGFLLPPTAGTDLPNYPVRDPWQPFLGEVRMYARVTATPSTAAWRQAVTAGQVFVTSGPMLRWTVNGRLPTQPIRISQGDTIAFAAEWSSPRPAQQVELVWNGTPLPAHQQRILKDGIHFWKLAADWQPDTSGWLAVRGTGPAIRSLEDSDLKEAPWHTRRVIAHSAAIPVWVDDRSIRVAESEQFLLERLERGRVFYADQARFDEDRQRTQMLHLFDRARAVLQDPSRATRD